MKKWIKPSVKVIVLDGEDIVTASSQQGVYGRGFQDEGSSWINRTKSSDDLDNSDQQ